MEEENKKRRGYKTKEGQAEAMKRYRNTENGKAKTKYYTCRSNARTFIKDLATDEDIEELQNLINSRVKEK